MYIKHIIATNFKNFSGIEISPSRFCNVLYGANGAGKTNFLDLIHFISLGKSYFSITDKMAVKENSEFFRLEGSVHEGEDEWSVKIAKPANGKKKIWLNSELLPSNSGLLGKIPIVTMVPDDIELIKGVSQIRRKFVDRILCQVSSEYTESLLAYGRIMKQKLSLFKMANSPSEVNHDLIKTYDKQLRENGSIIFEHRRNFIVEFKPEFLKMHSSIAKSKESVDIDYSTNFNSSSYISDSAENLERDFFTNRIRFGTHRDDIIFFIGNQLPLRKYGSQGQIKTFIYALKLTEYTYLHRHSNHEPIILLDDIFEKLDNERLNGLFQLIHSKAFGQIFISDTELARSENLLKKLNVTFSSFHVNNNSIKET